MSGKINQIPSNATSDLPLGKTLLSIHTGTEELTNVIYQWKNGSLIPRLRSIDGHWNQTILNILGGLYNFYDLYQIDLDSSFDGQKIFIDNEISESSDLWNSFFERPKTLEEGIFELYLDNSSLVDSYTTLNSQATKIKNYTLPTSFLNLLDTPNSYAGHAGKYIGCNSTGTSIEFLLPSSQTKLTQLTDAFTTYSYPAVVTSSSTLKLQDWHDARSWRIEPLNYSGLIDNFSLSGTALDNVYYQVNIGLQANNTAFHVLLGTTFHGARVCFKVGSGENLNNNKYFHADTGNSVTLFEGVSPDRHQFGTPKAFTLVYSTQTTSFYLIEKFEAF